MYKMRSTILKVGLQFCVVACLILALLILWQHCYLNKAHGEFVKVTVMKHSISSIESNPNQGKIVLGDSGGLIRVFDVKGMKLSKEFSVGAESISSLSLSGDGNYLAIGTHTPRQTGTLIVWDLNKSTEVWSTKYDENPVRSVVFSPKSDLLAATTENFTVSVWRTNNRTLVRKFKNAGGPMTFSSDGKLLTTAGISKFGDDNAINIWDMNTGKVLSNFDTDSKHSGEGIDKSLKEVFFLGGDREIIVVGGDSCVNGLQRWNVYSKKMIEDLNCSRADRCVIRHASLFPDEKKIAVIDVKGNLTIRNIKDFSVTKNLETPKFNVFIRCLSVSPDGSYVISGDDKGSVLLWNVD